VIRRVLLALLALTARCAFAQEAQPVFEADHIEAALDQGVLARGNVTLRDPGMTLRADEARTDAEGDVISASGRVVFTRGDIRLLADRLEYRRSDGSFSAQGVRLGRHPYFVEGAAAEGTREVITVEGARISYGEPGPWQPTLTADRFVYGPGEIVRTENAQAGIGHVQPVPFPRLQHSLRQPFVAFVAMRAGFRRSLGAYADAGMHVPVRPGVRAGADLGIFTRRGIMVGPSGRYSHPDEPEALRGHLRSGYIDDHGSRGIDLLGRPVPEARAFVEWQHEQLVAENVSLKAQLNWWKDSEVVRDFRPRAFFPVQTPDSFTEAVYPARNVFVSLFTRVQPNRFHVAQERLPELRFDLLPLALGNGFYERFHASVARLREDPLPEGPLVPAPADERLRSDRADAYYAVERPFAPYEWLAITPLAGGRFTRYMNTRGAPAAAAPAGSRNYTRLLGELGLDTVLRASGTFAYTNEQWKIDGLRHLLTPRLSYRYIPKADRGRPHIPQIDRAAFFSTYLQPLGLGDVRNIDELQATNTLRLSLDNLLQTRDSTSGTRELVALNVANDFRFKRRPGERDVSEIHTELSLTPVHWLQFDLYQSFAPQTFRLRELNSALTLRDANVWSVRFSSNFLRRQIEDYLIDGRVRINEAFDAMTRLHFDARRRRFNEQAYGIVHNLGNTWLISYGVNLFSGRRRESRFGISVQVETVRF
jgi:LPS-assembly protein